MVVNCRYISVSMVVVQLGLDLRQGEGCNSRGGEAFEISVISSEFGGRERKVVVVDDAGRARGLRQTLMICKQGSLSG